MSYSPAASILQGCQQACNMARVLVHSMLEQWHRDYFPATIRQYVDDMPQRLEGTHRYIRAPFPGAAEGFARGMAGLRLALSSKSALVCSDLISGR